jgi:hypothetical protein
MRELVYHTCCVLELAWSASGAINCNHLRVYRVLGFDGRALRGVAGCDMSGSNDQ